MSEASERWLDEGYISIVKERLQALKFADRVHLIRKLLKLAVEALDGMEAEVKRECP